MKKPFEDLRKKLIGLGEDSSRKSYYPELQSKIRELEESKKELIQSYQRRRDFMRNILHELRTPLHGLASLIRLLRGEALTKHQGKIVEDMGKSLSRLENLVGEVQHLADEGIVDGDRYSDFNLNDVLENTVSPILAKNSLDRPFTIDVKMAIYKKMQGKVDLFKLGLQHFLNSSLRFEHLKQIRFGVDVEKETIEHVLLRFSLSFEEGELTDEQQKRFYGLMHEAAQQCQVRTQEGDDEKPHSYFGGVAEIYSLKPAVFVWRYAFDMVANELLTPLGNISSEVMDQSKEYPAILIAEDNEINLSAMELILEDKKCRIFSAHNGKEALELFKQHAFSAVFLDMKMPIMGGEEALVAMREYEEKSALYRTPIVAITAFAMAGDRERILSLGADEYLAKPFDFAYFELLIDRYLLASEHREKRE